MATTTLTDSRELGFDPIVKVVVTGDPDTPIAIQVNLPNGKTLLVQFCCETADEMGEALSSLGEGFKP